MKVFIKQLLLVIPFVGFMIKAKAQLSYGAKAGVNIAKINFSNDNYTTSAKLHLYGGLLANYKLADKAAIQVELLYSGEGTKEKLNTGATGKINESYLHVPVLFQYNIIQGLYAEAGPQIGFLLSSKEEFNTVKKDIKEFYKSTDIRLPIGIGYSFNEWLPGMGIDLRYSFSLSKINKVAVGGGELKNNVFSIGIQYILHQTASK